MPLSKIEVDNSGGWALWWITETETELEGLLAADGCDPKISNQIKRLEWLSSRMLTAKLATELKVNFTRIKKDEFGKPFLENSNCHMSLSHSYPYVAVQISFVNVVGIDIEKPSSRISRVAHRVFSLQERADADDILQKNCIYWCAKEALYKIYGKRGLSYADNLAIKPFNLEASGELDAAIVMQNSTVKVELHYLVENEIIIVYTKKVLK
jgi:4'-phosphopantetheinyl transferase